jgi:hypothetical protein
LEYVNIELTRGYKAKIDPEDLSKVSGFKWNSHEARHKSEKLRTTYAKVIFCKRSLPMANVILGVPVGTIVDHINGDGLDNRKNNLRPVTSQQNSFNRKTPSHNTSGYKGVVWEADRQKWKARIKINNKYQYLGRYKKKSDAAKAYAEASERLHGEFGKVK